MNLEATTVQVFWDVSVTNLEQPDCDAVSLEEQKKVLPDLINAYNTSWQSMNQPHSDMMPKGVALTNWFISFDKELGITVCTVYQINNSLLKKADGLKNTIKKLAEDIDGCFDSWMNTHFTFTVDKTRYSLWAHGWAKKIVAPVDGCNSLMVRWNDVDEIEHADWLMSYRNEAYHIMFEKQYHKETEDRVRRRIEVYKLDDGELAKKLLNDDLELLDMYAFVKKNKDRFFFATYC